MTKKIISVREEVYHGYRKLIHCNTLGEIKLLVDQLTDEYGEDAEYEVGEGYDGIDEWIFKILEREETDEEYSRRLKNEAREIEREKAQFEMLKRKFGESSE